MTNKKIRLGMFVMTLAFGMITAGYINAQENGMDAALNGTWVDIEDEDTELKFNNGNFDWSDERDTAFGGTYTTNGNKITLQFTHSRGGFWGLDDKLYTKDQIMAAVSEYHKSDAEGFFSPQTYDYSVTGDTFVIVFDEYYIETYIRKK